MLNAKKEHQHSPFPYRSQHDLTNHSIFSFPFLPIPFRPVLFHFEILLPVLVHTHTNHSQVYFILFYFFPFPFPFSVSFSFSISFSFSFSVSLAGNEIHLSVVPATNLLILFCVRIEVRRAKRSQSDAIRTMLGCCVSGKADRAEFSPTRQHPP